MSRGDVRKICHTFLVSLMSIVDFVSYELVDIITASWYTLEDVEEEIARLIPQLPMAELTYGGIIKLSGANGFFNPNSLLDPSWLKGKWTSEEYHNAIDYINRCTAHTDIGLRKIYPTSERAFRAKLRSEAGMTAVQQLNQQYRSVRLTYQQTMENMQVNTSASDDPLIKFTHRDGPPVANATVTVLYIVLQSSKDPQGDK